MANQNFRVKNGLEVGVGGTILYAKDNGNIGVGTDNPLSKIHVESAATTAGWQIRTDSYGLSNESGFYRDSSDNYEMVLRSGAGALSYIKNTGGSSDANLIFFAQNGEKARITSGGNIGIGLTNPSAELEVRSTADAPTLTWNGSGQTIIGDTANQLSIGRVNSSPFGLYLQARASNNAARDILLNPVGGNIGIGTNIGLNEKLVVLGNAIIGPKTNISPTTSAAGYIKFDGTGYDGYITLDATALYLGHNSNGRDIRFQTVSGASPADRLTINGNTGNVGIATNNPSQTLDVNGNARFRGAIYDNNNVVGSAGSVLSSTGSGVQWVSVSAGSDAGTLDGLDSTQFLRSDADDTYTGTLTVSGTLDFGNVRVYPDTHRPGLLAVEEDIGSWSGLQIINGDTEHALMANSTGDVGLYNDNNDHWMITCQDSGYVRLYYNNAIKLETSNTGVSITGSLNASSEVTATSDISLGAELNFTGPNNKYVDFYTKSSGGTAYAANLRLVNHDSSSFHTTIKMIRDGAVELYHNNNKKFETTSSGVSVTGDIIPTGPIAWSGTLATFDPAGSPGTDTATDVAVALASGHRIAGHDNGYIRTLFEWNTGSDIDIGQSGTSLIAGINLIPGSTGVAKVNGNTIWHAGNDGSGSGLDADTLDGINSGSFLRSDVADTSTGATTWSLNSTGSIKLNKPATTNYAGISFSEVGDVRWLMYVNNSADGTFNLQARKNGTNIKQVFSVNQTTGVWNFNQTGATIAGNTIWHAGNDGSGSGLDADLLDGIGSGSFLRSDADDSTSGYITFTSGISIDKINGRGTQLVLNAGESDGKVSGQTAEKIYLNAEGGLVVNSSSNNWVSPYTLYTANICDTSGNSSFPGGISGTSLTASTQVNVTGSTQYGVNINTSNDGKLVLQGSSQPYIRFREGTTDKAYIQWTTSGIFQFVNQESGEYLRIGSGSDGLTFHVDGTNYKVFHAGNDGSGSGLDADTLDGINSGSFLRSDADDSTSGYLQAEGFVGSGGSLRIANPGGASFATGASATTGYLKVTLPVSWTNTMMRMTIKCYEYQTGESFDIHCGGYNYAPSTSWFNTFAYITGGNSLSRDFNVRFGHDGSKCAIYIGESNSGWSYFQFGVTDFLAGYGSYSASTWHNGWSCSITTSLGTITSTLSSNQLNKYVDGNTVWHAGNDGSGSGLDADLLDGQHGSYYTNASNINAGTFPDRFDSATRYNIGLIDGWSGSSYDKLRVWNSSSYTIGMYSGQTHGWLNDYAMTFTMNNETDRGWKWRDTDDGVADAAMSLTTNGNLCVSSVISVGGQTTRYLREPTGNYGSIQITGSGYSSWEGFSIDGRAVFMHDGSSTTGLYNDVDNEWLVRCIHNAQVQVYYNNSVKLETSSSGVSVTGSLNASSQVTATSDINLGGELNFTGNNNKYVDFYADSGQAAHLRLVNGTSFHIMMRMYRDGAAQLMYAGNTKFATTSSGVSVTGNLTASGTVTANSDIKLKKNVKTITGALDKVCSMRGVEFDYIENDQHSMGVIAQEVEEIFPDLVVENNIIDDEGKETGETVKSVAYGNMVAVLIEAIKEQQNKINELEQRLRDK